MPESNEFTYLLANLSELNATANKTIGEWYELLSACRNKRESMSYKCDEKTESVKEVKLKPEDEKILSFVENLATEQIANLKKQSCDISLAQQMIDGIAPTGL